MLHPLAPSAEKQDRHLTSFLIRDILRQEDVEGNESVVVDSDGEKNSPLPAGTNSDTEEKRDGEESAGIGSSLVVPVQRDKRRVLRFSSTQVHELEKHFAIQKYLTAHTRERLAKKLHLSLTQIKIWFQNRRYRSRKRQQAKQARLLGIGANSDTKISEVGTLGVQNNPIHTPLYHPFPDMSLARLTGEQTYLHCYMPGGLSVQEKSGIPFTSLAESNAGIILPFLCPFSTKTTVPSLS